MKSVDILIPIYNGLTYVRDCIDSVMRWSDEAKCNIYLLDDCSDYHTKRYLDGLEKENKNITHIRNSENLGFLKNCNLGFKYCTHDWFVLLNSDVIVAEGWLEELIICGESDKNIAAVNPLTNHASQINVELPPGCNYLGVNRFLQAQPAVTAGYPDIVTGVGFCLMLKREAIKKIGLFDEVYGKGYCEESDLCMRLTASGYRVVLTPRAYVYHKGRGTFRNRDELYNKNRRIFDQRWLPEYKRQFAEFSKKKPLEKYRALLRPGRRWDPLMGARLAYREVRDELREKRYARAFRKLVKGGIGVLGFYSNIFSEKDLKKFGCQGAFRVTYVLHNLTVAGGVLSVIQLVNQLVKQGVDAKIVALREYPEINDWQLLAKPIIFKSVNKMINQFPESDLVVATHWTTAPWVKRIMEKNRAKRSVYFLQDYEPWFFSDQESRMKVSETFSLVENKIVKSDWLSNKMKEDGFQTFKIRLGMNLDVFYPRVVKRDSNKLRVLAMARPRTPRRGYSDLVQSLEIVRKTSCTPFDLIFFGEQYLEKECELDFVNVGVVSNQSELAELYSSCDIFIDSSVFQGFGRPALEAMACGVPCVVTNVGGVNEYAENGNNCIAVPPADPDRLAEAIKTLIEKPELREKFRERGLSTAAKFCHRREGIETYQYFLNLLGCSNGRV